MGKARESGPEKGRGQPRGTGGALAPRGPVGESCGQPRGTGNAGLPKKRIKLPPGIPLRVDRIPPEFDGTTQRLLFLDIYGKRRIYEFRDRSSDTGQRHTLQFPQPDNRNYYRVGDMILWGTISRSKLAKSLPEYEQNPWFYLLLLVLGLDESTYKTAWRIEDIRISDPDKGEGEVSLFSVVFLAKDLPPVELVGLETVGKVMRPKDKTKWSKDSREGKPYYRTYNQICCNFIQCEMWKSAEEWGELILLFVTTFVSTVLSAGRRLIKGAAGRAVKSAVTKRIKTQLKKEAGKVCVSTFGTTFAKEIVSQVKAKNPVQDPVTKEVKIFCR